MVLYELGYSAVRALERAAKAHGASDAELAAIARFERGEARRVDIERLAPLAELAGLPWSELWP